MKILRTTLLILLSIFATSTIFARKSKHNKFVVTNNASEPVKVRIESKFLEVNPKKKSHTHEFKVGETYAFAILKTHDISSITITYSDNTIRKKSNFKVQNNGFDTHTRRNSRVYRGTMIITDDKATITTQKAGVTMEF